ncbi:MAG TPA: Retaining alpha-galactosidase [Prevotella sp.]|nr:Retaining alpha-galactosidase [Prevotella sp.]
MRNILKSSILLLIATWPLASWAKSYLVKSPSGRVAATINLTKGATINVTLDGHTLLTARDVNLLLADGQAALHGDLGVKAKRTKASRTIDAPFYRQRQFRFEANELDLHAPTGFGLRIVASDEGVAYRFYTTRTGKTVIGNETADYHFGTAQRAWLSPTTNAQKPYQMAFQNIYHDTTLGTVDSLSALPAFLPATVDCGQAKVTLLESDAHAYPGMWVKTDGKGSLHAAFAPYPKRMDYHPWRHMTYVADTEPFIATSAGARTYPWRVMQVSEKDTDMPTANMVYALAEPNRIGDTSWIKPGKVSWDWWSDWNLKGVGFRAGINTDTYLYYIDFAAKHGLEYVILDEGWYDSNKGDIMHPIADVDLQRLIRHANERHVGIILWAVFNVMDEHLEEACSHYAKMGVKGFKVDFMDRNDQTALEMVERLADCCARHHLVLDLHGIYTPTGLNRTYPNILNFESVFGMEEVKWGSLKNDHPRYDVTFPFIRMQAGSVDFTPGALRNGTRKDWLASYTKPMSQGTRCHQAAEYVVYDSPLTMLADVPTSYESEPRFTGFLASLPTVFDKTTVIDGQIGSHIVTLRQKGDTFYLGGMTCWDEHDADVALSFLPKGTTYKATLLTDGVNADRNAEDYRLDSRQVTAADSLQLHMASGGGFVVVLAPATR